MIGLTLKDRLESVIADAIMYHPSARMIPYEQREWLAEVLASSITRDLFSSDVVVDVDLLADDEDIVEYVQNFVPLGFRPGQDPYSHVGEAAQEILRALARKLKDDSGA